MIIRRKHTANFSAISNVLFNDERLQADEIGIIGYLMTRPHDWEVRRPALARRFKYGREAIKRVMWNGCRCGYIVPVRTRLSDGRFHVIYEVRDEPGPELSDDQVRSALSLGSSDAGEPDGESEGDGPPASGDPPADPATGQPGAGQPATGNPYVAPIEGATKNGFTKDESTNGAWAFSDVQRFWPAEHVVSPFACEKLHLDLSETMQQAAFNGVKPYLEDCRANSRKVCDLATYYRERRWERFQSIKPAPPLAVIKPYTAEFYRWKEYYAATGDSRGASILENMAKRGADITVPSRWPPAMPQYPPSTSAA